MAPPVAAFSGLSASGIGVDVWHRTAIDLLDALTALADGGYPSIAKPLAGLGSGVMELALRHRGDAFRVVYALLIGPDVWLIHAFEKKSKSGIATPRQEIDLVRDRLKQLQEILK